MVSRTSFYVATNTMGILGWNIPIRPKSANFLLLSADRAKPTLTKTNRGVIEWITLTVLPGFGMVRILHPVSPSTKSREE